MNDDIMITQFKGGSIYFGLSATYSDSPTVENEVVRGLRACFEIIKFGFCAKRRLDTEDFKHNNIYWSFGTHL